MATARVPPKKVDAHYGSTDWKATRQRILKRDRFTCVIPGCGQRACVVDHIMSRRKGGDDSDGNLRSLCRDHDNRFKENHLGDRRSGG